MASNDASTHTHTHIHTPIHTLQHAPSTPKLHRCVPNAFPSPLPTHLRLLAWLSVSLFVSLFYLGPASLVLAAILLYLNPLAGAALALAILISLTAPARQWRGVRIFPQLWYEIFDVHHNLPESKEERMSLISKYSNANPQRRREKTVMIATFPHGIIPLHGLIWAAICEQYLDGAYGTGAAADAVEFIPFLRNILHWAGSGSAKRKVLEKNLLKGENLFILPGGVAEIFESQPNTDVIVLKRRRGLVRLAMETNTDIMPAYWFGVTNLLRQPAHIPTSELSRKARAGMTIFWGQYFLPIPFPAKLRMIFGNIVEVPHVKNPSNEQIDEILRKLESNMHTLFEQHKALAGYPEAQLIVK